MKKITTLKVTKPGIEILGLKFTYPDIQILISNYNE